MNTISRAYWLKVLQLDASADKSAIKRAYFELVKTAHPDVVGAAGAARFTAISEAYQKLTASEESDDAKLCGKQRLQRVQPCRLAGIF